MIPSITERKKIAEEHLVEMCSKGIEIKKIGDSYALFVDGFNWMNTNDIDLEDHSCIFLMHSKVLFTGLGLGVAVKFALSNPNITEIVVIEKDYRVIESILPLLLPYNSLQKLTIVAADADNYEIEGKFMFAFLDHHINVIPDEVIARYKLHVPNVICWFDEVQKWL